MFKKLKVILGVSAVVTLCAGLTACAKIGDVEKYQKEGYDISVTYDPSGGKFYNRDGVSIVSMYKSEDHMVDGVAEIQLTDPSENDESLVPTKSNPLSFFAGWYKEREICTSSSGKPIDEQGRELVLVDEVYYVDGTENLDEEKRVTSTPKYTYSGYWNFETDRLTVTEESTESDKNITLYAGWVPYFSFDYYYKNGNEWVKYASTSFDYKAVNEDASLSDQNTIILPDWSDGKMSFTHTYSNGEDSFVFPDINRLTDKDKPDFLQGKTYTFAAAYEDEACTKPINGSLAHEGSFNAEKYEATNAVKNIYVEYDPFEKYMISTAEQLSKYAKSDAYYEIMEDLDFSTVSTGWPAVFSSGEFTGQIEGYQGNVYKISNAQATVSGTTYGGLFASVGANAVIKDITFEDAVVRLASAPTRAEYNYALFSGNINKNAKISGVTVGGTLRIGALTVPTEYEINLLAIGKTDGITNSGVSLQVYGDKLIDIYYYSIDAERVTVDTASGSVTLVGATGSAREKYKEYFDIISNWRQNND